MTDKSPRLDLSLTPEQARAVCAALDFYMRVGIGQIEEVAELMRNGTLATYRHDTAGSERLAVPAATIIKAEKHLLAIKALLDFPGMTTSHGVGHRDNHIAVHRSYEVLKVLQRAEAELRNPNPTLRGVDYDGLTVRYTSDPPPTCQISQLLPVLNMAPNTDDE